MSMPLLLLRPQPGNDETAARARALGLRVVQLPLFETAAVTGDPVPEGPFDALLLTSANGARFGAAALARYPDLPLYAVGEATAQAARDIGHAHVIVGGGDAASTAAMIAAAGAHAVLHVSGAEVRAFAAAGLAVTRHIVYRALECDAERLAPQLAGIGPAVAAVHSPRAGARLAALAEPAQRAHMHVVAIGAAAATACGAGWAGVSISARPDDTALLALAEPLCRSAS